MQSWRNENKKQNSAPRRSTKNDGYRSNSKVRMSGGYLDNAGRGSSVVRRMSNMHPTPSQGIHKIIEEKEEENETSISINTEKFEKVASKLEKQFPEPSARYSPDYDEISNEREIADAGSFGSYQSSEFDEDYMEHPLPHERSPMAPIYRTVYSMRV